MSEKPLSERLAAYCDKLAASEEPGDPITAIRDRCIGAIVLRARLALTVPPIGGLCADTATEATEIVAALRETAATYAMQTMDRSGVTRREVERADAWLAAVRREMGIES